jgi:hypothetical protein
VVGLRWFDRTRRHLAAWPHARSYVSLDLRAVDHDLDSAVPTVFDAVPEAVAALSFVTRGVAPDRVIGRGVPFALRTIAAHLAGDLAAWAALDEHAATAFADRVRRDRPRFAFAAFTGIDKASHAQGPDGPAVRAAYRRLDAWVARLVADLRAAGRWDTAHLWVVSDHGHAPIAAHDDLGDACRALGWRVLAHPTVRPGADVAVMVSGNAMAHLYLDPHDPVRRPWTARAVRWSATVEALLTRAAVDLVLLPDGDGTCQVWHQTRGRAVVRWRADGAVRYCAPGGDPLHLGGTTEWLDRTAAHTVTADGPYPDALVQVAAVAAAPRAGDAILSAAPGWDFRARWEPISHASTHGALHRDQMLVPLLTSHPVAGTPRRTTDVGASAFAALGLPSPPSLDGDSFL